MLSHQFTILPATALAATLTFSLLPNFAHSAPYQFKRAVTGLTVATYVNAPTLSITLDPATPPLATQNVAYSFDLKPLLKVTGGSAAISPSVTWSIVSGSLPAGLSLTAEGVLEGIPAAQGMGSIRISAAYGGARTEQSYTMQVLPARDIIEANGYRAWRDGTYASSCKAYLDGESGFTYTGDTGNAVYRVQIGADVVDTYCDMANGGWTLVAQRATASLGSTVSSLDGPTPTKTGYFKDAIWQNLKSRSTELRVVPAGSSFSGALRISMSKVTSANCVPLANTLTQPILFHHETTGCNATGSDYTMLGISTSRTTYVSNFGTTKWDVNPNQTLEPTTLSIWVR